MLNIYNFSSPSTQEQRPEIRNRNRSTRDIQTNCFFQRGKEKNVYKSDGCVPLSHNRWIQDTSINFTYHGLQEYFLLTGTVRDSSCVEVIARRTRLRERFTVVLKVISANKIIHCGEICLQITGYLFSGFGARCQPEANVACHRNNPLSRLLQRHAGHQRAKFFLMP